MSSLKYPCPQGEGYLPIVHPGNSELRWLEVGLLRLRPGQRWQTETGPREMALVILSGRVHVRTEGAQWNHLGGRRTVFDGRATTVLIPRGSWAEVEAAEALHPSGLVEGAVCFAPTPVRAEPRLIPPDQVQARWVGQFNWRRSVEDCLHAGIPAGALLLGETFNPPGNWSSYPPHKHDQDNPPLEGVLEEVYHYRISPPQGFGLQRIYTAEGDRDEALVIQDGDTVVIPRGYHPVVAAPGYRLYYLWVLAGPQRVMRPHDDPDHAWVHAAGEVLKEALA